MLCVSTSFSQFDQEEKRDTSIEEKLDRAIVKLENAIESLELTEFFEEELPEVIEDIKPSPERIDEIEQKLKDGVERLKEFDGSKLDDLKKDIEEGVEEIEEEIEEIVNKRRPQKI